MTWYGFFRGLVKPFVHAFCYLEVVGEENVPASGPCIVVANHQGFLDAIIVQTICKRPLHTLAKSTQFAGKFMGWVMPRGNARPTRRYRF